MEVPLKNVKAASIKKITHAASKYENEVLAPIKASKTSSDLSLPRLLQTELEQYCPKKIFNVVFVVESDWNSSLLLEKFVDVSKKYEDVSSVTFITREDVFNLLDVTQTYPFPNYLKPLLLDVIGNIKQFNIDKIPPIFEAQLLKLKLIQVMYQQYVTQVKQNQKEKTLEDLLHYLSRECKKKQKKEELGTDTNTSEKNKSPPKEDSKKKSKRDEKSTRDGVIEEDIDYTTIHLDNDGISFEENIFNHAWFYCIGGFYNHEVLQKFVGELNCPLCAIIKITDHEPSNLDISEPVQTFWQNIEEQFFGNTTLYSYFQDTIIMKFTPTIKFIENNILEPFQEFVFVLRRIVDIKLSHLKYLRHLKLNKIQNMYHTISIDCMQAYDRFLKCFPLEYVNGILILDALLKEVSVRFSINPTKSLSSRTISAGSLKSFSSIHCMDPLHDFQAFTNINKLTESRAIHNIANFLTHNNNELLKILKFNKHIGPKICDISLNIMSQNPILKTVFLQNDNINNRDIFHTHDLDPSNKFETQGKETLDNFLYLFLFKTFSNCIRVPDTPTVYNLTKNLITFNLFESWSNIQPKHGDDNVKKKLNLYDTLLVHYRWKEKLAKDVLIQEIYRATNYFVYVEQKYSPETDNFLVLFSDKLDYFGINTKLFEEVVRSPVCLRDFCRYTTVEEPKWLEHKEMKILNENTFKFVFDENCPGAQKVKSQMKIFQEYSYLLDPNIKEYDENFKDKPLQEKSILEKTASSDINFKEVFMDLQKYPTYQSLVLECENSPESQQLLSYNLGSRIFKVTGHLTTFCSHDGVKVTVDNTRFLHNPEKCTVNIISNGNTLTLHSSECQQKESYIFSLILKDNIRICFEIKNQQSACKEKTNLEKIDKENENKTNQVQEEMFFKEKENEIQTIEYNTLEEETNIEKTTEQYVHCVDEDFLQHLLGEDIPLESYSQQEDCKNLLQSIIDAQQNNGVIYKVNTKSNYLKKLKPHLKVPVEYVLKNVLSPEDLGYSNSKSYKNFTKRFESRNGNKSDLEIESPVDFRLCLPNGLFIRAHPGVVDKNTNLIKQEYAEGKPKVSTVQHEEFRLFSDEGFIFIKKVDGTVRILKANGDIIDFEKPTDGSEETGSLKPCHCSTLDDYRNKLNKLLKGEESNEYSTSRRGHILNKKNHIMDKKILQLLEKFDVPYLKKSITRFDGKKIKIQGEKITQKQLYHMTSQQDFFTEKIFFERSDDFRSTFERNGSQKLLFPDGTLISNSISISDELVDDFVYVTLSFQYEHPNYATVKYDFDKTINIILNNGFVFKKPINAETVTVSIEQKILISVSKEHVLFQRTCLDCLGKYKAKLNIQPFHTGTWKSTDTFLHVQDTYNKEFWCNFVGKCFRNSEFINTRLNAKNCNHYKKCYYKKMFVIKRDFSGLTFWTNDSVERLLKKTESFSDTTVQKYNMVTNKDVTVVDIRKKHYTNYCDRFFNNSIYKNFQMENSHSNSKELYTTYRIFHQTFTSVEEIQQHIINIEQVYFTDALEEQLSIFKTVAALKADQITYDKTNNRERMSELEYLERKKQDEERKRRENIGCTCIQTRMTMKEKIRNWKEACTRYKKKIKSDQIPGYFQSDFCNVIK